MLIYVTPQGKRVVKIFSPFFMSFCREECAHVRLYQIAVAQSYISTVDRGLPRDSTERRHLHARVRTYGRCPCAHARA